MVHRPLKSCCKPLRIRSDINLRFEYCGLVLFGAVRQTELYLTSSVRFGQNRKTPLRLVTIAQVKSQGKFQVTQKFEPVALFDTLSIFRQTVSSPSTPVDTQV